MPVRDLGLTLVIIGSLPICFTRPWIGVLMWIWIGVFAPQWLTWGFAQSIPFAQLIAGVTLLGTLLTKDRQPLPRTREALLLYTLWGWFGITTLFAMFPRLAFEQFGNVSKSLLFVVISLRLFQDRYRLRYMLLLIAGSVGFYGFKGGLFSLITRKELDLHLYSGLGGNTAFGLALTMILPLLFYLADDYRRWWLRCSFRVAFALCIVAAVFTYSRGAVLGLAAVLPMLMIKRRRPLAILAIVAAFFILLAIVPESLFDRVRTIAEYQGDGSAMGRILAWKISFWLAQDHPIFGAGFGAIDTDAVYRQYVDTYVYAWNAHSIWFNTMGEHGFPGFALFVTLIACCWVRLRQLRRSGNEYAPPEWVKNYSHMLELALLGYVVCGTFLSVAYLELFYQIVGAIILLHVIAERDRREVNVALPTTRRAALATSRPSLVWTSHVWNRGLR